MTNEQHPIGTREPDYGELELVRLRDRGASTVEVLGWAAMSTVALVAIGAALQALGVDIINNVRTQLGL